MNTSNPAFTMELIKKFVGYKEYQAAINLAVKLRESIDPSSDEFYQVDMLIAELYLLKEECVEAVGLLEKCDSKIPLSSVMLYKCGVAHIGLLEVDRANPSSGAIDYFNNIVKRFK